MVCSEIDMSWGKRIFVGVSMAALITYILPNISSADAQDLGAGASLSVQRSANSVVISWPDSDRTYVLEQTDSLAVPVDWVRAPRPSYDGKRFQLTVQIEPEAEAGNAFFRLRESTAVPSLAAANYYTAVLKRDGTLWMWGNWFLGQSVSPLLIDEQGTFVRVSAGDLHRLALSRDGGVWGWGDTDSGQLGIGGSISAPTMLLASDFLKIAAGGALSLAVRTDGTLWGTGVIAFFPPSTLYPWEQIGADADWKEIAVGGIYDCGEASPCATLDCRAITHSLAIKTNGTLWAWGENSFGQLGIEGIDDQYLPVSVDTDTNWVAISAGENHSLGLRSDGTLWAWGWNAFGQLGDGTETNRAIPTVIGADTDWTAVAAGYRHSVALKSDGSLWSWGCNGAGQLGDGSTTSTNSPIRIGTAAYVAIATGKEHTTALKADGTIWAWGGNAFGQLGDGTTERKLSPTQVGSVNH